MHAESDIKMTYFPEIELVEVIINGMESSFQVSPELPINNETIFSKRAVLLFSNFISSTIPWTWS
jgi:hypothetical protein